MLMLSDNEKKFYVHHTPLYSCFGYYLKHDAKHKMFSVFVFNVYCCCNYKFFSGFIEYIMTTSLFLLSLLLTIVFKKKTKKEEQESRYNGQKVIL